MVTEATLRSLVRSLDDPKSSSPASDALNKILEQSGENVPATAAKLAEFVTDLTTPQGMQYGLKILTPNRPNVPETIDLAVDLSRNEHSAVKLSATSFLAGIAVNVKAQDRLNELLEDGDFEVRNVAIGAVASLDHSGGLAGPASVLFVIPDDSQRQEALGLLDRLERAVNTLQDLGLDDGQNQIVNDLVLPDIEELKRLFGAQSADLDTVISERKRGIVTLGHAKGAAEALALGTAAVANAEKAAAKVKGAAEMLSPLMDLLKGLT